ncbi:ATP-binding cassette domain-containing protein [Vibrio sp. V27_P1S3P104]|uniref:ABC transporter ATP-binding protein n=1 Tax=unclassified Vibrio TaxID=2614977 RepID=UPI0013725CB4|nr:MULTISPECIES: ABC transporter ATP-binding protein [unclassified Vibrio]NAW69259.1 ATP-binding cassette domain-containing protein [Vibrio sp. V28_P6S34P95]NAX05216.1 ATP-binding cassette domain-containing protein [Vibrio sp. V30_P3S12P165]NAX35418.1 ATP-binding cassette domain-containing protein [Vibrio sp. V29_P1S30P107]NAX37092.1 ATP-binding cassette domain-containing protein [Vibrio sp. V27_P1S3P104]NAX40545.1 ATP-binding cassette domain-containing protein [Vibrio sp. V26_P1S5P106]
MGSLLEVKQLGTYSQQGWQALVTASFEVDKNECIAVIGPNGSGKSSLLKSITGEYLAVQGELRIDGHKLSDLSLQQKSKLIAVVAQNDYVDPRLTVREYVGLGRVPHAFYCSERTHLAAVNQALNEVRLIDKSERKIGSLSGGEQQRANIARAFAQEPKLLLLDEPTNHLDPLARLELLDLIKHKEVACIAVLHDLQLVAPFADRVILMANQRMVKFDSPTEILSNQYITPTFGLNVLTFQHPSLHNAVHHFEAASL